ncbi:hypothetical protein NDU88_003756 [Pleurodeles waltl]|uniref:Gypsy retrotransposon integrase-like protein 1 n=1 Tax=Pleurodeles waltl TaxID=8319 RepID=A0AAV7V3B3_PLEWA|nr:hypothetical protein NDU88_003756 [Pleurodeles waltl]
MVALVGVIERGRISHNEWVRALKEGEVLAEVIRYVKSGWPKKKEGPNQASEYQQVEDELSMIKEVLWWNEVLVVPEVQRRHILGLAHESHSGASATKLRFRSEYWWAGMDCDVEHNVRNGLAGAWSNKSHKTVIYPPVIMIRWMPQGKR